MAKGGTESQRYEQPSGIGGISSNHVHGPFKFNLNFFPLLPYVEWNVKL